jgi:hypothetical protein
MGGHLKPVTRDDYVRRYGTFFVDRCGSLQPDAPAAANITPDRVEAYVAELKGRAIGTDLFLHQQGIDTSSPAGRAMFQIMGVFAEMERACIRERVLSGLARGRIVGSHREPGATPIGLSEHAPAG